MFPQIKKYFLKIKKVNADLSVPLSPLSTLWHRAEEVVLPLIPTPIGRQVSRYLKYAVDLAKIGKIKEVKVKSLHNGEFIQFFLEWRDKSADIENVDFPDAAGILFPVQKNAPQIVITTMGTEKDHVNVWYWRAGQNESPRDVVAKGLGTSETLKKSMLFATALRKGDKWLVVLGRRMKVSDKRLVQFNVGEKRICSVAVWDGHNMERAALKSFCPCALEIFIEK